MKLLFFSLFLFSSMHLFAQGNVEFVQDPRLDNLIKKHTEFNEAKNGMDGYRIQIFFDSGTGSKSKAYSHKSRFLSRFPNVSADIVYEEPNYKVRVGDFRSRMEAQGFLNEIKSEFGSAFIVIDIISLPDIKAFDFQIEE
jgi:hypothetical protein